MATTTQYPFHFDTVPSLKLGKLGSAVEITTVLSNTRGSIPSIQCCRLRSMINEAHADPTKIVAHTCPYDGLSARLVEEAGFPLVFLGGYSVASSQGLPDVGYIAMQEMCDKIQEVSRQISIPIFADGDTGYGSPMNVRRTVECFAKAGAAGIMIEDQSWPKRCGHTNYKSVVSREEAYARIRAACDARNEGLDIVIMARTDSLILGFEEAITRCREFIRLGVDAIFIEAIPDLPMMKRAIKEVNFPICANMIEGGKTELVSTKVLAKIGFAIVGYPITLVAAHIHAIRTALENLKRCMMVEPPRRILDFPEVCESVGFNKYWATERRYIFEERGLVGPEADR